MSINRGQKKARPATISAAQTLAAKVVAAIHPRPVSEISATLAKKLRACELVLGKFLATAAREDTTAATRIAARGSTSPQDENTRAASSALQTILCSIWGISYTSGAQKIAQVSDATRDESPVYDLPTVAGEYVQKIRVW